MQGILDAIIEEKFDSEKGRLLFTKDGELLEKLELVLKPGEVCESSFTVHAPEGKYTYGYVSASDSRMECITTRLEGTEEIHFCFHGEHLEKEESCRGEFLIRCNQGEFSLPFEIAVEESQVLSSEGPVNSLIHFSNLAKVNWPEAVRIFYTPEFEDLIREKEPQLYLAYQSLSDGPKNEHNLDQFLIAAGKKRRMTYFVEDSLLALEGPEGIAETSVGILRNGWGYTRLDVETEGDFVFAEKETITDDDFLGNRYKLSVYINGEKLHAGKNLGRLILWDNDISVEVPIEVYGSRDESPAREVRRQKRQNNCKLTDTYLAFRLKEMNTAGWLQETDQLVQTMLSLDEKDGAARLFFAQILITAERYNEAGWVLEHMGEFMEEASPEMEAYYLYLSSLLRKDEGYTRQVAAQIARIYKEQGESWRVAWLLLYVSQEYEKSVTGKWLFLEEQFEQGSRSPLIYFEAVQLLNRNPALLRKLERFELQVLYYGNKKGVLSPELLEQVYYLAGRVREFSPLLYRILVSCYEKTRDERIVKEICTLLIKGNRVEKKYYRWFKLGIEAGIRITNLYEYYMMSLDLEKEEEIPKIVLLYFTYQSNLDYAHAAYLYQYVISRQEDYPEVYESYRSRIQGFVREQIQKERMNEHLDKLYHLFLSEDMLQKHNAQAILKILFSYRMKRPNSRVVRAYVYQKDCTVPAVYTVSEENIWLPIYAKESCVVWEDPYGNRFLPGYPLGIGHELADHPIVKNGAVYIENNTCLDLYLYEAREMVYEADTEVIARLFRLWENEAVALPVRRESAVRIMKYYYQTSDREHLSAFLKALPEERLSRREASEAIKYMTYCRMDELAYDWMQRFSPVFVDSKISASLLSAMIRKKEYAKDWELLIFAYDTFAKGKYTSEILRYLTLHYEGTAHSMYQIWKAAYVCDIDVQDLSRRLLTQMLFTDVYVKEHGEVFRKYLKGNVEESLILAYLIRRSYAYYLEKESLDESAADRMLQLCGEGMQLPVICQLSCLKFFMENETLIGEERGDPLQNLLRTQLQNGIRLPWFRQWKGCPESALLTDMTILEYHARGEGPVKFRYLSLHEKEPVWKVVNMYQVCRKVFFTEQLLFFGESLQYEILEETEGEDVVMQTGQLKKAEKAPDSETGRFRAINTLLETKTLGRESQFERLLEDYLKKDFINGQIFTLMQ